MGKTKRNVICRIDHFVHVDLDMLTRQNFDELFEMPFPFPFGALPDVYGNTGFKLPFSSGVLEL